MSCLNWSVWEIFYFGKTAVTVEFFNAAYTLNISQLCNEKETPLHKQSLPATKVIICLIRIIIYVKYLKDYQIQLYHNFSNSAIWLLKPGFLWKKTILTTKWCNQLCSNVLFYFYAFHCRSSHWRCSIKKVFLKISKSS